MSRQTFDRSEAKENFKEKLSRLTVYVVGVVLLVAGSLKLYGFLDNPLPRIGWLARPHVQVLAALWELFLGLWLVSGCKVAWAWRIALANFVLFAGVAAYFGWIGMANCGCFGRLEASPWTAFGVDLGVVFGLALMGRPRARFASEYENSAWAALLSPVPSVLCVGLLLLSIFACWAMLKYGSLQVSLSRLRGQVLTLDEPYIDLGEVDGGRAIERTVIVRNWSDVPLRIAGSTPSCAFDLPIQMPAVVPPGGSLVIPFRMRLPQSGTGVFAVPVGLWTDCDTTPVLHFDVGGLLRNAQPTQ